MEERPRSREEAKRETREALLLAGIAEFSERGLAEPSLDAICSRAGYTRGAFYVHFRDRDDLISAVMEQVLGDFLDAIIATGDQERDLEHTVTRFMDALAAATRGLAHHVLLGNLAPAREGSLQFHRVLEASARSPEVRERFAALLQGAIDEVEWWIPSWVQIDRRALTGGGWVAPRSRTAQKWSLSRQHGLSAGAGTPSV